MSGINILLFNKDGKKMGYLRSAQGAGKVECVQSRSVSLDARAVFFIEENGRDFLIRDCYGKYLFVPPKGQPDWGAIHRGSPNRSSWETFSYFSAFRSFESKTFDGQRCFYIFCFDKGEGVRFSYMDSKGLGVPQDDYGSLKADCLWWGFAEASPSYCFFVRRITANDTTESGHDELYVELTVDGVRIDNFAGISSSNENSEYSIKDGQHWNCEQRVLFQRDVVFKLRERDPHVDDDIGQFRVGAGNVQRTRFSRPLIPSDPSKGEVEIVCGLLEKVLSDDGKYTIYYHVTLAEDPGPFQAP